MSPRRPAHAAPRRIVIFSAASPAETSRRCLSRTGKRPKSSASASSGPRQRRRRRFAMAALPDPSTSAPLRREEIARAVASIASNSASSASTAPIFWFRRDAVWLIEVNPRPGATLDVFESDEGALFARHVAACEGRLTPAPLGLGVQSGRNRLCALRHCVARGTELAGLDGRPTVAGNAHRRRRSAVHDARLWRDRRIGANLRRRTGAKDHRHCPRSRNTERRRGHKRQSPRCRTDGRAAPRRRNAEPRLCAAGRSAKP